MEESEEYKQEQLLKIENVRRRHERLRKTLPPHFQNLFDKLPEDDRKCSICLELMTDDLQMTSCFHFFHRACLNGIKKTVQSVEKLYKCE